MISYLCAYLRCYYPGEFITAYLNNAKGSDDIEDGTALAELYHIPVRPPRFGTAGANYTYDQDSNTIAKGTASISFMNPTVSEELLELSHQGKQPAFMDLLLKLKQETSLNARQRDILIRVDYFEDYGNSHELLAIVEQFDRFKGGDIKKISKSTLDPETEVLIAPYCTDKNANGSTAKSYTIQDISSLLHACEDSIRQQHLEDFDLKTKAQTQLDYLGYVSYRTGQQSDRCRLLITDISSIRWKSGKTVYNVKTHSLGSGKDSSLTVSDELFRRNKLEKFDIITTTPQDVRKSANGYWHLYGYRKTPLDRVAAQ